MRTNRQPSAPSAGDEILIACPLVNDCYVTLLARGEWTRETYDHFVEILRVIADTFPPAREEGER